MAQNEDLCPPYSSADYDGAYSFEAINNYIISLCDFETLVKLTLVSKELRHVVRIVMFERVTDALAPFLGEEDVLPFFEMLYSVNGAVFGDAAQQVACPGSGAALWTDARHRTDCLAHLDLNILVPGPDALEEVMNWLHGKGYVHWRVKDLVCGWISVDSNFAVSTRDSGDPMVPRTRAITVAFGSAGAALSTLAAPLGDKIGIISPSRVHRLKTNRGLQMNFDYDWQKLSTPWSPKHDEWTPKFTVELIGASVTRHVRYRECRNKWCRDGSLKFGKLGRVRAISMF